MSSSAIPIDSLQDLLSAFAGDDPASDEWQSAVRAAVRESTRLLIRAGALNAANGDLYESVGRVAEEGFNQKEHERELNAALDLLPDKGMEIESLINTYALYEQQAAYVLGLAVGMRLAGGVR